LISFQGRAAPAKLPTNRCSSAEAPVRNTVAERRCSIFASPSSLRNWDRRLPSTLCIRKRIPAAGCSKTPQGLLFPLGVRGLFVHVMWFHRVLRGDSGALVDPFMHVGTYPTRHLATLRESELLPAFAGPWPSWTWGSGTCTGQDSGAVHTLSRLRLPVFLLNSRDPLATATCRSSQRLKWQTPLVPKVRG
jgi:hypothetical protein